MYFKGAKVGKYDSKGKMMKEGDIVEFKTSMYGDIILLGKIRYDNDKCMFYIDRKQEPELKFPLYNLKMIKVV